MNVAQRIRVLLVDGSAVMRRDLAVLLERDPAIQVVATAVDPLFALDKLRRASPDVVVSALALPRMDGLHFLRQLMREQPTPMVLYFAPDERSQATPMQLMSAGASAVVARAASNDAAALEHTAAELVAAVKSALAAQPGRPLGARILHGQPRLSADAILPPPDGTAVPATAPVVLIGTSTGGTEALARILKALPAQAPGIAVVQHMPAAFTGAFAARLKAQSALDVWEASDGDALLPGRVLIAPGGRHMLLQRQGTQYRVSIHDGPPVNRHRPSVDVLFRSAAQAAGRNALGIIMTGMGDDGARGLLEMRHAGAATLAQDEASCVVYGMPKEAVALGAVDRVLPLDHLAGAIMNFANA